MDREALSTTNLTDKLVMVLVIVFFVVPIVAALAWAAYFYLSVAVLGRT